MRIGDFLNGRNVEVHSMPHEQMNEQQVATYLTMDLRDVIKWASRGQVPCRKVGDQKYRFRKGDIDHWIWEQMHSFDSKALKGIERGVSAHHGFDFEKPLICPMISEKALTVPLQAKTSNSVIRGLLEQAEKADLIYARDELINELIGREKLCSTAMLPGVAFPHPRQPMPYEIASSFIVVGVTSNGIPFGAKDGSLTRLFFLVCCKDDRTHLHVLARLVRILDERNIVERLMDSETPEQLGEILAHRELEVLHQA